MNTGTRIRTICAAIAALVGAYYTYRGLLDDLLNQLGLGIVSIIIALCAVIGLIISEAAATYFNNDYTETACYYTGAMRQAKAEQDPEYQGEKFYEKDEEDE